VVPTVVEGECSCSTGELRTPLGFELDRLPQALVRPLSDARGQALLEFSHLIAVTVSELLSAAAGACPVTLDLLPPKAVEVP
jgi:hypothetical protein